MAVVIVARNHKINKMENMENFIKKHYKVVLPLIVVAIAFLFYLDSKIANPQKQVNTIPLIPQTTSTNKPATNLQELRVSSPSLTFDFSKANFNFSNNSYPYYSFVNSVNKQTAIRIASVLGFKENNLEEIAPQNSLWINGNKRLLLVENKNHIEYQDTDVKITKGVFDETKVISTSQDILSKFFPGSQFALSEVKYVSNITSSYYQYTKNPRSAELAQISFFQTTNDTKVFSSYDQPETIVITFNKNLNISTLKISDAYTNITATDQSSTPSQDKLTKISSSGFKLLPTLDIVSGPKLASTFNLNIEVSNIDIIYKKIETKLVPFYLITGRAIGKDLSIFPVFYLAQVK